MSRGVVQLRCIVYMVLWYTKSAARDSVDAANSVTNRADLKSLRYYGSRIVSPGGYQSYFSSQTRISTSGSLLLILSCTLAIERD